MSCLPCLRITLNRRGLSPSRDAYDLLTFFIMDRKNSDLGEVFSVEGGVWGKGEVREVGAGEIGSRNLE